MEEKSNEKVKVINGVTIRDITPKYTGEELQARVNELAANLLAFDESRKTKGKRLSK